MAISGTLRDFLSAKGVGYDVVPHEFTQSSVDAAKSAHIPGDQIAKAVVLGDVDGYLMAVVPSTRHVELGILQNALHRELSLVSEAELCELFADCEVGAVPPVGSAFGLDMVLDVRLAHQSEVYFEAGDHEELIHVSGTGYRTLTQGADIAPISRQFE